MLPVEIVSPTRLLFHYTKALSKSDKLRVFIYPNMTDLTTFLDNNGKYAIYKGGDINIIYSYLEMIGDPLTFITLGQRSHHFIPSSSINNDTASLQPVIAAICARQKSICEWCESIGHKADAYTIHVTKLIPPSLRRKMNQSNALHGDEPNKAPREWKNQPPAYNLKYRTFPSNPSPVVSDFLGTLTSPLSMA